MKVLLNQQTDPPGVGLAAPQVGGPLQLFIIKPTAKSPISVFVNPKIINQEETKPDLKLDHVKNLKSNKLEGCLSIPRIWGSVKRLPDILLQYQTILDETKEENFDGFEAVIIQHEIDHLNGVLFTQRVLEQNGDLYEDKAGELVKSSLD